MRCHDAVERHCAQVQINIQRADLCRKTIGGIGNALTRSIERLGRRIEAAQAFQHRAILLFGQISQIK